MNSEKTTKLILASSSPRRQELIRSFGLPVEIIVSDVDENTPENWTPPEARGQDTRVAPLLGTAVEAITPGVTPFVGPFGFGAPFFGPFGGFGAFGGPFGAFGGNEGAEARAFCLSFFKHKKSCDR